MKQSELISAQSFVLGTRNHTQPAERRLGDSMYSFAVRLGQYRVGPGNLTPSPSQNSGLEPLDSSGSCHPMRAAALRQNRRAPPVSSWPIMVSTSIACPLRSTDITPLQRYYQAVRPSASHPYARPRGSIHLWLLRLHRCQGSHVPYARLF